METLESKTRGRGRRVPHSGGGWTGRSWNPGGPRRGGAPGPGSREKSGSRVVGVPPLRVSGGVGTEGGAHLEPRQGSEGSHLAQDGVGLGAARGTSRSRGPGHLWVQPEVEGRGRAAESGVFPWVVAGSSKRRGALGKGRVLTPRRRLGSGSEPPVGAGRGWGRGRGSRWAARAPGSCGGRGSVPGGGRRRGTGRGHAGPTPTPAHAGRARTRSGTRPAEPGAGAGSGRVGCGGRRRLAGGARGGIFRGGESGTEGRRGGGVLLRTLYFLRFPCRQWGRRTSRVGERRPERAEGRRMGHRGCGRGGEGRPRARTLLPPTPTGGAGLPWLLRPAPRARAALTCFPGVWGRRPGQGRAAVRPARGVLGRSLRRGASLESVCFSRPRSPSQLGSGDNLVTCRSGALWCGE